MIYFWIWVFFTGLLLFFTYTRPHPYRFSRFIAFECLLSLIFLNASHWFLNPFSLIQIISWIFLLGSFFLALSGFYLIKTKGEPSGDIEDTTKLIKSGVYGYIRHPLYASLLLFGLGAFLKDPNLLGGIIGGILIISVEKTARIEEEYNTVQFGEQYSQYCEETNRFIPFIY
jgi:protein-S-isoprenylcysteine O-methyltransferase Ste14